VHGGDGYAGADLPLNTSDPPPPRRPTGWAVDARWTITILLCVGNVIGIVVALRHL
jgi:hypothetical protein